MIADEEEDTLVESLEEDSFDAHLADFLAPSIAPPPRQTAAAAMRLLVDDVMGRIDEALLCATEQREVFPLYLLGGAAGARAMVVPAALLFALGYAIGLPDTNIPHKTFTKPVTPVAATIEPPPRPAQADAIALTPASTAGADLPEAPTATQGTAWDASEAAAAPRRLRRRARRRRRAHRRPRRAARR